jgi:hypothetical protein
MKIDMYLDMFGWYRIVLKCYNEKWTGIKREGMSLPMHEDMSNLYWSKDVGDMFLNTFDDIIFLQKIDENKCL